MTNQTSNKSHQKTRIHPVNPLRENRASSMTSGTEGIGSPVPTAGRLSSKETVKARAAVQARIALHRLTPRSLAPTLQDQRHFLGTSWGQSCEELRRLNIPSTSHLGGKNHQSSAGHPLPQAQGRWFPSCAVLALDLGGPVPSAGGDHHCSVHCAFCSSPQCDKPPTIERVERRRVHIAHKTHSWPSTCLPADLRGGALQRETLSPTPPASEHAARWWPKHVGLAAHIGRCGETGEEASATFDTGANRNGWGVVPRCSRGWECGKIRQRPQGPC